MKSGMFVVEVVCPRQERKQEHKKITNVKLFILNVSTDVNNIFMWPSFMILSYLLHIECLDLENHKTDFLSLLECCDKFCANIITLESNILGQIKFSFSADSDDDVPTLKLL